MATQVETVKLQQTSTRQELITNRMASNQRQNDMYSASGGSTSTSVGVNPSYLPQTVTSQFQTMGNTTTQTAAGTNNVLAVTSTTGGKYKKRSKRRKTKRNKRKKSKRRRRNKL
jgi:hypothetical protein